MQLLTTLLYLRRSTLYRTKVLSIANSNLIAYFPLNDLSGITAVDLSSNNQRADYTTSGITYNVAGVGFNGIALTGADTNVNIRTSVNTFDSLWNGNTYSMLAWGKVDDITRWNDLSTYRYLSHIRATDPTYYTVMGKSQTANQLEWRRRVGGPIVSQTYTYSSPPTDWFCMGMTCDQSIPEMRFYLWDSANGWRKVGTSNSANITAWAGNAPAEGSTVLGAGSLTLQEWIGSLANCAFWNITLTDAQMQLAMTP